MSSHENLHLHDAYERLLARAESDQKERSALSGSVDATAPEAPELDGEFGPYRLLRTLGRGGQGMVYLAEDSRLGRRVALKLLSASAALTETTRARFEREAMAASRLRHPNICTVYEAGEFEGQRFLAMEYVDGESLPDWIQRTATAQSASESGARRERVDRALAIVQQLAEAVQVAHEAGVVHRDLKPHNVMLRQDGAPVVLDFGLAGDEQADDALTMQGDVLGTPAYMPPERVRGAGGGAADPREDVYGLGAILYECLTGDRPFRGATREQLYQRILTKPVEDPRRKDGAIPREARFVVETALDKDPDRRYATAQDLAEDLRRLRRRAPLLARPVPGWLRLLRWVQRNPAASIPTLAAFAVLIAGIVTAFVLLTRVDAEARHARIRVLLAESSKAVWGDAQLALLLAREADRQLPVDAPDPLRASVRSQLLDVLAKTRRIAEFAVASGQIQGAAFSADGDAVVAVVKASNGPNLLRWSLSDPDEPWTHTIDALANQLGVTGHAFDPSQERVAVASVYGTVWVFATRARSRRDPAGYTPLLHELTPVSDPVAPIFFRQPGDVVLPALLSFVPGREDLLVVGSADGVRLWRLPAGRSDGEVVWHDARPDWAANYGVCGVAVSADGALCASAEHDGTLRLLDMTDGSLIGSRAGRGEVLHALAFDPGRPLLLAHARQAPSIEIYRCDGVDGESAAGEPRLALAGELPLGECSANCLRIGPNPAPRMLAIADDAQRVQLLRSIDEAPFFEEQARFSIGHSDVFRLEFSPDGTRLAIGDLNGDLVISDLEGNVVDRPPGPSQGVHVVAWSRDGQRLLSSGQRARLQVHRVGDPEFRVVRAPRAVVRLKAAGHRVVAGLRRGSVFTLDLATGATARLRGQVSTPALSVALSADGDRLAVGGMRGRLDRWDLRGSTPVLLEPLHVRDGADMTQGKVTFCSDGSLAILADGNDARSGRSFVELYRASADGDDVELLSKMPDWGRVAFAADGIVVEGHGRTFWDCRAASSGGRQISDWGEGRDGARSVAASGDGTRIVTWDRWWRGEVPVRVVDARERRIVHEWEAGSVWSAALSADGSRVLTAGWGGVAKLWDVAGPTPRLITELRGHEGVVRGACFSPDGRQLITGGSDGTIRFWPAQLDDLDQLVERRLVREWTDVERARYAGLIGR